MHLMRFTAEEILFYSVSILAIVSFGSGFTHLFAHSFADPPPEEEAGFDFNPFTNLDIVGTIVFFLGGFGWGRQVDDQKIRFKRQKLESSRPRRDKFPNEESSWEPRLLFNLQSMSL